MKIKDTNLTIMVKDMEASIAFYQSLGLELANRWGEHYAQMKAPGLTIGLHPASEKDKAVNSGNVSIGFITDDFETTRASLHDLNIAVTLRVEEGGQFLHFTDPDGTALYFIQPKW